MQEAQVNLKHKVISVLSTILLLTMFAPSNTGVAPVSAGGYCDWIQFVADVTVPDGWPVDPGQVLKKTWRLKNIGTCTWTKSYKLVFTGGTQMGGVSGMNLPKDVAPGQTIDLTIGLTSPTTPGSYLGYWQLQNPAGGSFGIGPTADKPFFVEIEVVSKAPPVYAFATNAPSANWGTEATGRRPFPGVYGDPDGFVQVVDRPILENGIPSSFPGILMAPPVEYNEHIYGVFPAYEVKQGDRFQTFIGCEYGSKDCDVTFVLQYQNPDGGGTRTFWSKKKTYKDSFTWIDLKLGKLAGQKVSFVLLVRPNGSTTGDHAMWANPVIVNSNQPAPSIPTVTPIPVTAVPTVNTLPPGTSCDRATFVADVTVPDGTNVTPGQAFTKTWRLRNTGQCTWTTGYSLVFSAGDQMGGASSINLPTSVAPRQTIDLSVNLTAPESAGSYRGYWLLKNAAGRTFGIGSLANKPFWLAINVTGSPLPSVDGYDFVSHVCDAQWTSGAGSLPCREASATNGMVAVVDNPRLENNTVDPRPALLTVPQLAYNGYIQGVYPPFTVQNGDRFKSVINCEYGQKSCYLIYRLDYQVDNGPIKNFWAFGERHEGLYYQADIDLSPLAGQNVKFILRVDANGSPTGDRALWVAPSIVRSGGTVPSAPTPTSTVTPTLVPASTQTSTPMPSDPTATPQPPSPTSTATSTPVPSNAYVNSKYGFTFLLPANSSLAVLSDNRARVTLPIASGTTLVAKYLEVVVVDGLSPCRTTSFTNPATSSSNTVINGITFLLEAGTDSALGNVYEWRAYSASRNNACITMNFILHSANNGAPPFDAAAESAVFESMMATFGFTGP
jgi:hypothetical protein